MLLLIVLNITSVGPVLLAMSTGGFLLLGKEQEDPVAPRAAGLSLQLLPPAPALPSALVASWRFDMKSLAVPPLGARDLQPEKWLKSHFSQCS